MGNVLVEVGFWVTLLGIALVIVGFVVISVRRYAASIDKRKQPPS